MHSIVIALLLLFAYTYQTQTMQPHQGDNSAKTRKIIEAILYKFKKGEYTVDQTFAALLPPEITRKIVHHAYGKELYDFFIRSQGLELFHNPLINDKRCHLFLKDKNTKITFNSNKGDPKRFAFYKPNCVYHDESRILVGHIDGSVSIYLHESDREWNFSLNTNPSPVTSITYPQAIDEHGERKFMFLAGHLNGQFTSMDVSNSNTWIRSLPEIDTPITSLFTTQRTVIGTTDKQIIFLDEYGKTEPILTTTLKPDLNTSTEFVDIGYQEGCIVFFKTSSGEQYELTPYNLVEYQQIMEGSLTPTQAGKICRVIRDKCLCHQIEAEEDTLHPFEVEPATVPLMEELLANHIKSKLIEMIRSKSS